MPAPVKPHQEKNPSWSKGTFMEGFTHLGLAHKAQSHTGP